MTARGVINRYRDLLPLAANSPVISLGEGDTPLVAAPRLSGLLDGDVYIKVEGANPTGSFKDRGMTVAVSAAAGEGTRAVVCASTGNTSASAAAYAVRANMTPIVLLPEGKIAKGKLAQAIVYGATVLQLADNFDACLSVVRELAERYPVALVNSVNPMRIAGQMTAAFEIADEMGDAPDIHALPVGNAGNIAAYWAGYTKYQAAGRTTQCPQMWGFQAAGAAPLVTGKTVVQPETVATAIRIGNPASAEQALAARDESGGRITSVTDAEILDAQAWLAANEGVFVEPASAAGVAGLMKAARDGEMPSGKRIAITVTGNGLKDIDTALSRSEFVPKVVAADADVVAAECGL